MHELGYFHDSKDNQKITFALQDGRNSSNIDPRFQNTTDITNPKTRLYRTAHDYVIQLEVFLHYEFFDPASGRMLISNLTVDNYFIYEECCKDYANERFILDDDKKIMILNIQFKSLKAHTMHDVYNRIQSFTADYNRDHPILRVDHYDYKDYKNDNKNNEDLEHLWLYLTALALMLGTITDYIMHGATIKIEGARPKWMFIWLHQALMLLTCLSWSTNLMWWIYGDDEAVSSWLVTILMYFIDEFL